MMITGKRRNKTEMIAGLAPGYVKTNLIARNTIKVQYPDGTVIVRYWDTDVVAIKPDGIVILNSGGFMTQTAKERIAQNTKFVIEQKDSIWSVYQWVPGTYQRRFISLFYDGITIAPDGTVLSGARVDPAPVVKRFKRDLKRLTDKITKESVPRYMANMAGDCLICRFDLSSGKITTDHLFSHVKEGYMHGSLIVLCLKNSGYGPGVLSFNHTDLIRSAVRKVISDHCIPEIINNPGIYPGVYE